MNSADRNKKFIQQTEEQYALLGKFVNKFELMIFQLRNGIRNNAGFQNIHQQRISNIFFAELSAQSLVKIYKSIVLLNTGLDKFNTALLSSLHNRTIKLITKRNEIVHGTYFIGWASQDDVEFNKSYGFKNLNTKNGGEIKPLELNKEKMSELISECEFLSDFYIRFSTCLMIPFEMRKNLPLSEEEITLLAKGRTIWASDMKL